MNDFEQQAADLAKRAVETAIAAGAEQAEALSSAGISSLTRFARNRIHQNVTEQGADISVRAVVGTRVGVASTNLTTEEGLRDCCLAAVGAARSAPDDPSFPGLPGPAPVAEADRAFAATRVFDAVDRAEAVRAIIDQSAARDLEAAGGVKTVDQSVAVANSLGVDVAQSLTSVRATVLSMSPAGGSGWASFLGADASDLAAAALGDEAATLAERSENAGDLDPGVYTVVLAPEAVADIIDFCGWLAFGAKAVTEGRSIFATRLGEQIMSAGVTIADDALSRHAMGLTFDYEGQPKRRVGIVEAGSATDYVTDSYYAALSGRPNSGHALPAPNSYGPLPLNLELAPGDASIDELVARVQHGVYVTRFHYVNVEDPVPVTLTGMTRDGTFMIENGHLTRPLKNLRFTQSAIEALAGTLGITRERRFVGTEGSPTLVPGLLLERFRFTGQTS